MPAKKRADGRFQKSITLPNGKRKVFYGKSQAEINRKIASFRWEDTQGPYFSDVAEEWKETHDKNVRYKTSMSLVAPYNSAKKYFEGVRIKDITTAEIVVYVRIIEAKGLAQRTVQLYRDTVSMIMDYGIAKGAITYNPCMVSLSPGLKKTTRSLPSQTDIQAIKDHRDDDPFSLLPFLLLYTGLRVGEALALRREDFDFRKKTITINKKVTWSPNQPVIDNFLKTDRGVRTIPLLDVLQESLPKEWDGYLFGGDKPYTNTEFRHAWKQYAKRTGVQCDRHSLRHEFVTIMYEAGLEAPDAAAITGHDIRTMQKTYLHITEQRKQVSANKLNSFVNGKTEL